MGYLNTTVLQSLWWQIFEVNDLVFYVGSFATTYLRIGGVGGFCGIRCTYNFKEDISNFLYSEKYITVLVY